MRGEHTVSMAAMPTIVRLIPSRLIQTQPTLQVKIDQLERAERLRRELKTLVMLTGTGRVTDWPAAINKLLESDSDDEQRSEVIAEEPESVMSPVQQPTVEPDKLEEKNKWIHLQRCSVLSPDML